MIETGEVKNQSDLASKLDISRAHVCQMFSLLKLDKQIVIAIEKLGDHMSKRYISERKLRSLVKLSNESQRATFSSIIL